MHQPHLFNAWLVLASEKDEKKFNLIVNPKPGELSLGTWLIGNIDDDWEVYVEVRRRVAV